MPINHSLLHCAFCQYSSVSSFQFMKHSMEHDKPTRIVCPFCTSFNRPYTIKHKYRFRDHLLLHLEEDLACTHCPYTTKNMPFFLQHMRAHSAMHKCHYCPFTTRHREEFYEHNLRHMAKNRVKTDPCLKCPACLETNANHAQTAVHLQLHVANKEFSCAQCEGKVMLNSRGFRRHMLVHHLLCY
ncbi:protein hunchback-like [Hyalella azteca]|uniref:Protein hunchback-like n=1 Tax=Hyalella azteca TaxID=294128 RepID=A0A8B7P3L8_HYAAZ|nr:protein hunchback-like [Hyalella azteca]